jgi:hypothetical protein
MTVTDPSSIQMIVEKGGRNAISIQDLEIVHRLDLSKEMLHIEVFRKSWMLPLLLKLPRMIYKPIAKTGIRTYSSSGAMMESVIAKTFSDLENAHANYYGLHPLLNYFPQITTSLNHPNIHVSDSISTLVSYLEQHNRSHVINMTDSTEFIPNIDKNADNLVLEDCTAVIIDESPTTIIAAKSVLNSEYSANVNIHANTNTNTNTNINTHSTNVTHNNNINSLTCNENIHDQTM